MDYRNIYKNTMLDEKLKIASYLFDSENIIFDLLDYLIMGFIFYFEKYQIEI